MALNLHVVRPQRMLVDEKMPFTWRSDRPARIGVLPKSATSDSQTQWFELPAFYLCHTVNAWQEPDSGLIRVFGVCIETSMVDLDWASFEGTFPEELRPRLSEIVLDPKTGDARRGGGGPGCWRNVNDR